MLEQAFAKLGLNANEQEVYLAVLKAGKISYARVSQLTGINRTTVYSIAHKLAQLGLLSEDLGGSVSYLATEGTEAIERMVEKEEEQLAEKKKAARELIKELASYRTGQQYSVPRIKFVEETDLSDYLYRRYAQWSASALTYDNAWWGYHDPSFTDVYGKWIDWCWDESPHRVYFFTNSAQTEENMGEKHPNRKIKVLPGKDNATNRKHLAPKSEPKARDDATNRKHLAPKSEPKARDDFDSSLWVAGDYIIMVQSRERPHYLIEICDPVLARNQRQLFKKLWNAV